jgi:hypothetical protein
LQASERFVSSGPLFTTSENAQLGKSTRSDSLDGFSSLASSTLPGGFLKSALKRPVRDGHDFVSLHIGAGDGSCLGRHGPSDSACLGAGKG